MAWFRLLAYGCAALIAGFLEGCATIPAPSSPSSKPVVLERDFKGRSYAKGSFLNNLTGQRRGFTVVLDGRKEGESFVLREDFTFADGERDVKTWRFMPAGPGSYQGRREDVIGEARVLDHAGAVLLSYDVELGESRTHVHFEDVIERKEDGRIVNRAIVSKLGFPVGAVDLEFARRPF